MTNFNENNSDFYDLEYYISLEYRYFSGAHDSKIKNIFKHLDKLELNNKNILDVGCGGGFLTNKILELGSNVIGCDYSKSAIKFSRERYPKLKVIRSSAYEIDKLELNNINLITSFDVIEHLKFPDIFLKKCFKVLDKKGILIIGTDNDNSIFSTKPLNHLKNILMRTSFSGRAYRLIKKVEFFRRQFKDYHQSHISSMSLDVLSKKISQAGFDVLEVSVFSIVSIPILDMFSNFLPISTKGDYQLIICVKNHDK